MKCFYHPDLDAVGICKNCGRGLCPQSLAEVEDGLACRGRCEAAVSAISAVLKRNQRLIARSHPFGVIFTALIGVVLIAMGVQLAVDVSPAGFLMVAMGVLFLAAAA